MASIPNPNPIPNSAVINYQYSPGASLPNINASNLSSTVSVSFSVGMISNTDGGLIKAVDKPYETVFTTLTYTVYLRNTGNVSVTNLVILDTIPNNTIFIANSLSVNGTTQVGGTIAPPTGFNLGSLQANQTKTITFKVFVTSIPIPNPITNSVIVNYNYTSDPSIPNGNSITNLSNSTNTQINVASINNGGTGTGGNGFDKIVDKAYATLGDELTYTLVLKNTGNVSANNIVIVDTIPSGTTFVANSIEVDGISKPSETVEPPTGYSYGNLAPGVISTVTFKVLVVSIPTVNPIPNLAYVGFNYTMTPSIPNGATSSGISNSATTQLNVASIDNSGTGAGGNGFTKLVTPLYAGINDTITYTLILTNTGNVTANNIIVTDTLVYGTSFIANSLAMNGVNQTGQTILPPTGFTVSSLAPMQTTTITFNAIVTTIPSLNPLTNSATVNFSYTTDPANVNSSTSSGNSNTINATVNYASIDSNSVTGNGFNKICNKTTATIGITLTYTLILTNTGNVTATNLFVVDTIPPTESFVPGSVTINNSPSVSDPNTGINIVSLPPLGVATISFIVTVLTLPTINPVSNQAIISYNYTKDPSLPNGATENAVSTISNIQINDANLRNSVKFADKNYAKCNDIINYTVVIPNSGNITAINVVFVDTIPNGTSFIPNSLSINNVIKINANPEIGVTLPNIAPNEIVTLTFSVIVSC